MEKDLIALIEEFLLEQPTDINNNIFYQEDVGGVKYEFVLELPDDIPTKTGISGNEIIDVKKLTDNTVVNVQRVFPDGETVVDYSFNARGKGGDVEAYKNFNKILKEGEGMKGVLLNYYDTFPVETTLPTTGEVDDDLLDLGKQLGIVEEGTLDISDLSEADREKLKSVADETANMYDLNDIENYANGNQRITPEQVSQLEELTGIYKEQANNIVNKLPVEETVKKRLRNKLSQMSVKWTTFSGAGELLDIYETGVLLFYGLVAAKPELEKIASNYLIDMYNTMAEPYGVKVNRNEYTPDWKNINEQLNKAEKITPTDIIIKKTKELVEDVGETGMVTGFGYVPTTKEKLNKTLANPKPVEDKVVDPMYDRIKRTFSGKFVNGNAG